MPFRETLEQAGLTVVSFTLDELIVRDQSGKLELWFRNDGHASSGIVWNGHDYEFARSLRG